MKRNDRTEYNDYFDFVDFFNLIKNACSSGIYAKDIFVELTFYIYKLANHSPNSDKDDMNDLLKKRKAFNADIINMVSFEIVDDIAESLKECLLKSYVKDAELLADKVIFLAKKDKLFFTAKDIKVLESYRSKPAHVLAYTLIVTIRCSKGAKNYKHNEDTYNPFKDYILPEAANTNTLINTNSTMFSYMEKLSKYQYENYTLIRSNQYDSELLSKGAELYSSSKIKTSDSLNLITTYDEIHLTSFQTIERNNEGIKDLDTFYKEETNLLIIGEGGIGKTTYLYSRLKSFASSNFHRAVPIYVKLSNCSTMTDHRHMIINEIINITHECLPGTVQINYRDIWDEFSKNTTTPEYVLLLDGFNEITPIDYGEIRTSISEEINTLLAMPNVKIILTSRATDFCSLHNEEFLQIEAKGINKDDVIDNLSNLCPQKELDRIKHNTDLLDCLQIPLFLLMFKEQFEYNSDLPQNRGSILYNYYNNSSSLYNEKLNATEKTERKIAFIVSLLLDFVLPDLGYYMDENNLFSISRDTFFNLIDTCCETIKNYAQINLPAFQRYNGFSGGLFRATDLLKDTNYDDLFIICSDFIDVLYKDASYQISFNHQYIRDYFSSVYCLRSIYYGVGSKNPNNILSLSLEGTSSYDTFDKTRYEIIEEVYPAFTSDYMCKELFADAVKICQGTAQDNNTHINGYVLPNIIQLLSDVHHGDLSAFDFSGLNISSCNLANKNFYNPVTKKSSDFSGSYITDSTFTKSAHIYPLKKWNLTSDKKHIISIDSNCIVKLWNIANQTCVYSVDLPHINNFYIYDIDMHYNEHYAFILIAYFDEAAIIKEFATYNITTSRYTRYTTSIDIAPADEDFGEYDAAFVHCGYDNIQDCLYSISTTGILYYYSIDDSIPDFAIRLESTFAERIQTHYLNANDMFNIVNGKTKKIILLPNNLILYLESDVAGHYFHGIDGIVYEGDDWECKPVNDFPISAVEFDRGYPTRHINIFIYNIDTKETHDLQLKDFEDITSLAIPATYSDDVLEKYVAISQDKTTLVLHNLNDIYVYHINENDYTFKIVIKGMYNINGSLSFVNEGNDLISLYDESRLVHYNLAKGSLIFDKSIGHSNFSRATVSTDKYHVTELSHNIQGAFQITNIYTDESTSMSISTEQLIHKCYKTGDYLFVIYTNGTVVTLDANTLSFISIYNYCPDKHVIDTCYDESNNCLCILCSPMHSFLFSNKETIIHINMTSGEITKSLSTFHSLRNVYYVQNSEYIIAAGYSLILLDTKTMTQQDMINPQNNKYDYPITIFADDSNNQFHMLFPANKQVGKQKYNATLFTYIIEDNKFCFVKKWYIPEVDPKKEYKETKLLIKPLTQSSVCIYRAKDNININVTYVIRTTEETQDTCFESIPLNQWNLAYIDADDTTADSGYLTYDSKDIIIISSINDNNLLCRKSDSVSELYVYNIATDNKQPIKQYFDLQNILYNDEAQRIYCFNAKESHIKCYDIISDAYCCKGPQIHPSMLVQNCKFNDTIPKRYIPDYFIESSDIYEL